MPSNPRSRHRPARAIGRPLPYAHHHDSGRHPTNHELTAPRHWRAIQEAPGAATREPNWWDEEMKYEDGHGMRWTITLGLSSLRPWQPRGATTQHGCHVPFKGSRGKSWWTRFEPLTEHVSSRSLAASPQPYRINCWASSPRCSRNEPQQDGGGDVVHTMVLPFKFLSSGHIKPFTGIACATIIGSVALTAQAPW